MKLDKIKRVINDIPSDVKNILGIAVIGAVVYKIWSEIDKKKSYEKAAEYYVNGKYSEAYTMFKNLGAYKLASDYAAICRAYLGDDYVEDEFEDNDIFGEEL